MERSGILRVWNYSGPRAHVDIKGGFSPCPFDLSVKQLPFNTRPRIQHLLMVKEMQNTTPFLASFLNLSFLNFLNKCV